LASQGGRRRVYNELGIGILSFQNPWVRDSNRRTEFLLGAPFFYLLSMLVNSFSAVSIFSGASHCARDKFGHCAPLSVDEVIPMALWAAHKAGESVFIQPRGNRRCVVMEQCQ
jgi:hypothetical protein